MPRPFRRLPLLLLALAVASCSPSTAPTSPSGTGGSGYSYGYGYGGGDAAAAFKDDVQANNQPPAGALELPFVDAEGQPVDLGQYRGKKNVVLVVTRGFNGEICPSCSAQTSRLVNNYGEFKKRNAEVLVVFPGPKRHVEAFVDKVQNETGTPEVPFAILLDEELRAVDRLGIREDLARPATYILDRRGQVRFAYVGVDSTDRPSVKAMLKKLDELAAE